MIRTTKAEFGMGFIRAIVIALVLIFLAVALSSYFFDTAEGALDCKGDNLVQVDMETGCDATYSIQLGSLKTEEGKTCCQRRPDVGKEDFLNNYARKHASSGASSVTQIDTSRLSGTDETVHQFVKPIYTSDGQIHTGPLQGIQKPTSTAAPGSETPQNTNIRELTITQGETWELYQVQRRSEVEKRNGLGVTVSKQIETCVSDMRVAEKGLDGFWHQVNTNVPSWLRALDNTKTPCPKNTQITLRVTFGELGTYKWDVQFLDEDGDSLDASTVIIHVVPESTGSTGEDVDGDGVPDGPVNKAYHYAHFFRGSLTTKFDQRYCLEIGEAAYNSYQGFVALELFKTPVFTPEEKIFYENGRNGEYAACFQTINGVDTSGGEVPAVVSNIEDFYALCPSSKNNCEDYNQYSNRLRKDLCVKDINERENTVCKLTVDCYWDRGLFAGSCVSCNELYEATNTTAQTADCSVYTDELSCESNQCLRNKPCAWDKKLFGGTCISDPHSRYAGYNE